MAIFKTADLADKYSDTEGFGVANPIFKNYGRRKRFSGPISTVKVHEDNLVFKAMLEEARAGSVIVVDGGASVKYALMDDSLARLAMTKHIAGIIINGAVRSVEHLANFDIAILALASCPVKAPTIGKGESDIVVDFASISWQPNHYAYGDVDGVIVSPASLI